MNTILDRIKLGQASTILLQNNKKANVGWIRIEDSEAVCYTGKGLREIYKPDMTEEERKRANELDKLPEETLISEGYIQRIKISEIKDILS